MVHKIKENTLVVRCGSSSEAAYIRSREEKILELIQARPEIGEKIKNITIERA
jgi:hypothetical protein